MTISINEITSGIGLLINGEVYLVTEYHHVKPGKGSAFVRVKLKNIKSQQALERTFKTAEKLEEANLEERRLQNLYQSGDSFHFMDVASYEEITVPKQVIGDGVRFLQDNLEVVGWFHDHHILKVDLPNFIIAEVTHTEPGFKGDTSGNTTKSATIDTGTSIQVPLFINIGDRLRIDTRNGAYVERVKQ